MVQRYRVGQQVLAACSVAQAFAGQGVAVAETEGGGKAIACSVENDGEDDQEVEKILEQ